MIEKRKQEKQDAAKGLKERLETMEISLEMPTGDTGRLFGSVTNAALAEHFASQGVIIERKKIIIPEHSIKMVGITKIQVRLYGEEVAEVKVEVVPVGGKKTKVEKHAKSIAKSAGDTVEEPKSDPEEKAVVVDAGLDADDTDPEDSDTPADATSGEE